MTFCRLIVIGASWGGLHAVGEILAGLPADFRPTVLVVQHRAEDSDDLLAGLLDRRGPLPVREVEDKDPLSGAGVLVAPAGYHVLVEPDHFELSTEAEVRFSRPSIDVTLENPETDAVFKLTAKGRMLRVPPKFMEILSGTPEESVDAHSIQPYYTVLLAAEAGMELDVAASPEEIVFSARMAAAEA